MGEIAHVDLDRLHRVADSFSGAAAHVEGMKWPGLDPDALPGSAVAEVAVGDLIAGRLGDLIAGLNGWAGAARSTAEAFQQADFANGKRFTPR
ncbi:hypothetical protein C6A85_000000106665 [Mycobacterium sp. ITM-2017-0098]|nr:hypothetical protein C6A85_000000106665 [Mycobacterium sp. ITM-2017-0098]